MSENYKIRIDDDCLDYLIKKKRNIMTLTVKVSGGGCCPTFELSEIDFEIPKDKEHYSYHIVDDIHIYISKNARVSTSVLSFTLSKSFIGSSVHAVGLSLIEKS